MSVVEPDPANAPSGTLATTYAYDWMNHVSQVTMARAGTTQTRTFVYSDAGLLTSATNPENGTVSYTYNADNTLQKKHDANGLDTVYTYDSKKRVTVVQDNCRQVTYAYDTNPYSTTFSQNTTGRLTAMTYLAGDCAYGVFLGMTEMYSYHPAGAVTAKSLKAGTAVPAVTVSYTYDSAGRVATEAYPTTGAPLSYGYDGMGRPNSLGEVMPPGYGYPPTVTIVQNDQYDLAGRMSSIQYGSYSGTDGYPTSYTQETMTYNVNGQLASLNWSNGAWGNTGLVGGIQYHYSATQNNGQITQAVDTLSGETIGYQYDALKRLTSASSTPIIGSTPAAWTQTYQYDGFGNLTAKALNGTTTPIGVNAATNRLSSANYDANGNMTSGFGASFGYDTSNRMEWSQAVSGGMEHYGYAPDNKRVFRQLANGSQQVTLYGVGGEKLYSFDPTGSVPGGTTYVWFGGKLIFDGNPAYQDRLGTNRAGGARFLPYGEEITSTANDHVKFGTYERDSYTGLDYADQRFYASTYGRFSTADPYRGSMNTSDPGSLNRYAYAWGDPINSNDPSGLCVIQGVAYPDPCFSVTGTATGGGGGLNGFGGAGGYAAPQSIIPEPPAAWDALSYDCQRGLKTAHPSKNEASGIPIWLDELGRANDAIATLQQTADKHAIDWELLAAVAVRESGFFDMNELGSGKGVGVFQIDLGKNPSVTAAQANNLAFAADFAANLLATNMAILQAKFPNFTPDQLLQATAASYNFGVGNISGNPATIDVGSSPKGHGNYGSNILNLMKCFP